MPKNTEPGTDNSEIKTESSISDKGFPEGVPVAEMAEAQKAAYYQFHLRKKEDQLKKLPSTDELKRLRQAETDLTELRNAQLSDQEKALEAVRAQGEQAAADRYRDLLVAAEFRAVAAGRVPVLDELVQDLRLDRYITEAGEPDAVAITARVESHLPAATAHINRALILLLAYTGLQWSEASALKVGRVDLEKRRIRVVQTFSEVKGKLMEQAPKTWESAPSPSHPRWSQTSPRSFRVATRIPTCSPLVGEPAYGRRIGERRNSTRRFATPGSTVLD